MGWTPGFRHHFSCRKLTKPEMTRSIASFFVCLFLHSILIMDGSALPPGSASCPEAWVTGLQDALNSSPFCPPPAFILTQPHPFCSRSLPLDELPATSGSLCSYWSLWGPSENPGVSHGGFFRKVPVPGVSCPPLPFTESSCPSCAHSLLL